MCIFGFWGYIKNHFPSKEDIDNFFVEYRNEASEDRRIISLKGFLLKLSDPRSVSDDYNIQYAMDIMAKVYLETKDEAILVAVDETPIDAGFANFVCGFYSDVIMDQTFQKRYRNNDERRKALERCVGISLSEEELGQLYGEGEHP